jgi:hypothetical protein
MNPIAFSEAEQEVIDSEINDLLGKGAISECEHTAGEFVSNIFTRPKRSGGVRVILNLKELNKFVVYKHFKMEHIDQVTDLIFHNDFMTSIDLTDAYFSVKLHESSRKFVRFIWQNKLYEYCCLCFGYAAAPRLSPSLLIFVNETSDHQFISMTYY